MSQSRVWTGRKPGLLPLHHSASWAHSTFFRSFIWQNQKNFDSQEWTSQMSLLLRLLGEKKQQETTLWEEKMELEQTGGERLLSHSLGRGPERWGKVRPEIYSSPVGRAANAKGSMEAVLCALPGSNIVPVGSGALWPGCSVKWELWEIRDLFVLFHQAFLAAWMVPRTK